MYMPNIMCVICLNVILTCMSIFSLCFVEKYHICDVRKSHKTNKFIDFELNSSQSRLFGMEEGGRVGDEGRWR